jgi:hypothetical protein
MNQTTQDVIEYLNFPESDFGTTPLDAELLQDPALLRDRVAGLLDSPRPSSDSRALADTLHGRLGEADWDAISREMQERVKLASGFFDPVEENIRQATK